MITLLFSILLVVLISSLIVQIKQGDQPDYLTYSILIINTAFLGVLGGMNATGIASSILTTREGVYYPNLHFNYIVQLLILFLAAKFAGFQINKGFQIENSNAYNFGKKIRQRGKISSLLIILISGTLFFIYSITSGVFSLDRIIELVQRSLISFDSDRDANIYILLYLSNILVGVYSYIAFSTFNKLKYIKKDSIILYTLISSIFFSFLAVITSILFVKKSVILIITIVLIFSYLMANQKFLKSYKKINFSKIINYSKYTLIFILIMSLIFIIGLIFTSDSISLRNSYNLSASGIELLLINIRHTIAGQIQSSYNIYEGDIFNFPLFDFKIDYLEPTFGKYIGLRRLSHLNRDFDGSIEGTYVGITSLTQSIYVFGIVPGILWLMTVYTFIIKLGRICSKLLYNHINLYREKSQLSVLFQGVNIGLLLYLCPILPQIFLRRVFDIPAPIPLPITWYLYPLTLLFTMLVIFKLLKIKTY